MPVWLVWITGNVYRHLNTHLKSNYEKFAIKTWVIQRSSSNYVIFKNDSKMTVFILCGDTELLAELSEG